MLGAASSDTAYPIKSPGMLYRSELRARLASSSSEKPCPALFVLHHIGAWTWSSIEIKRAVVRLTNMVLVNVINQERCSSLPNMCRISRSLSTESATRAASRPESHSALFATSSSSHAFKYQGRGEAVADDAGTGVPRPRWRPIPRRKTAYPRLANRTMMLVPSLYLARHQTFERDFPPQASRLVLPRWRSLQAPWKAVPSNLVCRIRSAIA